jgi:hypothetical protein
VEIREAASAVKHLQKNCFSGKKAPKELLLVHGY